MFVVDLNNSSYEYDIHALVNSFYPGEQVRVLTPETGEAKRAELVTAICMTVRLREPGEDGIGEIRIAMSGEKPDGEILGVISGEKPDGEILGVISGEKPDGEILGMISGEKPDGEILGVMPDEDSGGAAAGTVGEDAPEFVHIGPFPDGDGLTFKQFFKRYFYTALTEITGRRLPWGNLTGIRPTKIAYGLLEEGKSDGEIRSFYANEHFVSDRKAALALDIARRERQLLSGIDCVRGYSLYLGIPFCPTTCLYCSFTSFPIAGYRKQTDRYLDCLIREAEFVAKCYRDRVPDTVYIGGGTPTTLEPEQLRRLIGKLRELFDFTTVSEFTVEAGRADSITGEKLAALRETGVTRISVNPQTMNQKTLDIIGRKAGVEQVREAYALARQAGFDNINMDLILGLPGETAADVRHTIDEVVRMAPDSLTVHSLAIKRASGLSQWIQENGTDRLVNTDETMEIAAEGARRLGMEPYYLYRQKNMSGNFENVGYARPGKFGLYNILIMEEVQTIVALGAGTITKRVYPDGRIERMENVRDVKLYMEQIDDMIERKRGILHGTE